MPFLRIASGCFAAALCASASATERYSGSAYSSATDALLFQETHYLYGAAGQRLVLYRCPDGRAFARKRVYAGGDAQTPDFDLTDARLGYREGVREHAGGREVYVQRRSALPELADPLQVPADGVIDTGFDAFAQRHWTELVRGDTLRFPYLVPSRRTFFSFKVARVDGAATPPGTMMIRLASSSWISFLLPHIDVTYDIASRRVVRYQGLSNIRDDNGKNYQVHVEYPALAHAGDVNQAEIDAALAAPLSASCSAPDTAVSASGQSTVPEVTSVPKARNPNP
jgi:hypothetical protein